jgi:UDP-glucose 4-epimerase
MKILVSGSAGQVGSSLAEYLMKDHQVVGVDLRIPEWDEVKKLTIKGDVRDAGHIKKLMKDMDVVVHAAAQVNVDASLKEPIVDASHNIDGTLTLLECARDINVQRFIYISSAAVYGNPPAIPITEDEHLHPISPYGASKLTGEIYSMVYYRSFDLPTVCIRPFNIYSERQDPESPYSGVITRFKENLSNGKPPVICGDGGHTRDFVHVCDVVKMIERCISSKRSVGRVYNCGTGIGTSIKSLADLMIAISGKNVRPAYDKERPGEIDHSVAEITRAKMELGFQPSTTLEKGLRELLES